MAGLIFGLGGRAGVGGPPLPARPTTDRTTIYTGARTATRGSTLVRPPRGASAAMLLLATRWTAHSARDGLTITVARPVTLNGYTRAPAPRTSVRIVRGAAR